MDDTIKIEALYRSKLLVDYLNEESQLINFLGRSPSNLKPIRFTGDRHVLKKILMNYNKLINVPQEVLDNIEKVDDEKTFFVVTGQQPGLLTGPLYTIYKALSAIYYAKKFSNENLTLIPLFWNASEDHDINEIAPITIVTKEKELKTFMICTGNIKDKSAERIKIQDANVEATINDIVNALPATDFTEYVFNDVVKSELSKSTYCGEFFSRLISNLLGRWGLIIVEPYIFRPYLTEFFKELIHRPLYYNRIFLKTTEELRNLGYSPKLHKKENIVGLFYIDETGKRNKITINSNSEYVFENDIVLTRDEVEELVSKHPERFSTNAIFRPIAQDKMIPTFIYAGGPSEIGYHIQITNLYPAFGMTQPNLLLRMGATILEKHIDKVLQKYSLNVLDLKNVDFTIKKILKDKHGDKIKPYITKILATMNSLEGELAGLNKGLAIRIEYKKQQVEKILASVENMYINTLKRENELLLLQLRKANENIFPLGKPQERVFNVFQYLNKYSFCFLDCIKQVFEQYKPGSHVVIKCWT